MLITNKLVDNKAGKISSASLVMFWAEVCAYFKMVLN